MVGGTHPSVCVREREREREHSPGLGKIALFGEIGITLGPINSVAKYMK